MNIWLMLLLQVVLIFLNAVFACAEIAVISINEAKLEKLSEEGNKNAKRLQKLKKDPAKFLATIQVAITLSGFLGSAFAADNFSEMLVNWIVGMGVNIPVNTLDTIAVILITLILSYFTLVFGELVPKRIAMRKSEKLGLSMTPFIAGISKVFYPLVWLLTKSTNGILRLFGVDPNAVDEEVSEEDIRMMVDVGSKKGAIDIEEKNLIKNVFEFDDLSVESIQTHRTDVDVLWLEESPKEWDKKIRKGNHKVYPICGENSDEIVGVLHSKEYFMLGSLDRELVMKKSVKKPYFVLETVKLDVLFRNMKETKNFFAVVMDEYGGMTGVVTIHDVIEALIGDIEDDIEDEDNIPDIEEIEIGGEKAYRVKGSAILKDIEKKLKLDISDCDCDTFSGFVFGELGSIPNDGCQMELKLKDITISLDEIEDHQLKRATVFINKKEETEPEEKDEKLD